MRFALVLNLLGTGLLFFSFQATSSNVQIVRTHDGATALCVNDFALISTDTGHRSMYLGSTCPTGPSSRAIAVVNIEHPLLVTIGFLVLSAGFLLQFLSIPTPKTIAQLRKELKEHQKQEQKRLKRNPHTGLPHSK
jgi:hypothetical protein